MGIPIGDLSSHELLRRRLLVDYDINILRELLEPFIDGIEVTRHSVL
jgi:hypothetical protein